jgi:arabinose-5-phosphate isomerase
LEFFMPKTEQFCQLGRAVIETEAQAIIQLVQRINHEFALACQHLLQCKGRIVVLGMGKSGHIGSKIAATLASTGSPAFFVHPGEASHGDLGMITPQDVVLAISYSGNTQEIVSLLPVLKRLGVPLISMTGNPQSTLALSSDVNIDISVEKEACPLGLAPTSSTTATLVMGDALAIALLEARGFTAEDFALSHPGGTLGRRLLLRVDEIMHKGDDMPHVSITASLTEALLETTQKRLGMTAVVDAENKVKGIFTDGDLRRALQKGLNLQNTSVVDVMTPNCKTIHKGLLAAEALEIMETMRINGLLIVDDQNKLLGVLGMHDLLRAHVL